MQFFIALFNYFQAFGFLLKNHLWKYILIPGILSLVMILIIVIAGFTFSGDLSIFLIENIFPSENNNTIIKILLNILVAVIIFVLGVLIYRPFALILLSPFLSSLSEKTENIIYGEAVKTLSSNFIKDLQRSIRINIRYFLFSSFYSLGAIASGLLPVIGAIISTTFLFLIQAYYGGSSLADIILERRGLSVKERLQFAKDQRALLIGSGAGFLLILLIPVIGWFIAPGLGVIATTISLTNKIK